MEQAATVVSDPVYGALSVIGQAWRSDPQWSVSYATTAEVSFPVCQNVDHDVVKCQTLHIQIPEDYRQAAIHLMLRFIWGWDTSPKTEMTKPSAKPAGAERSVLPYCLRLTGNSYVKTAWFQDSWPRVSQLGQPCSRLPVRVQAFCRQATQTDTLLLSESFGCPLFAQPS